MSRPSHIRALLGATVLAVVMVGCGGSPDPTHARNGIVEITLTDYRMAPQVIRSRRDSLTIRVTNTGRLPHAFRIRGRGGMRVKIATLKPGESAARVGIDLPRGDWRIFCPLSNHEELGMYGALVIR